MREIKFRAWDKLEQSMHSTSDLSWSNNHMYWKYVGRMPWQQPCDYVLMQYTGLKDKNGVKVYEGDFLEECMYVKWCDEQGGFQCWLPDDYCLACNGDMYWHEVVQDMTYEVIGNIYENPDLLR